MTPEHVKRIMTASSVSLYAESIAERASAEAEQMGFNDKFCNELYRDIIDSIKEQVQITLEEFEVSNESE